jgi:hypothetical protein
VRVLRLQPHQQWEWTALHIRQSELYGRHEGDEIIAILIAAKSGPVLRFLTLPGTAEGRHFLFFTENSIILVWRVGFGGGYVTAGFHILNLLFELDKI